MSLNREPVKGTWAGLTQWICPITGYAVIEEPGIDAYARVKAYTDSLYPEIPEPEPITPEPAIVSVAEPPVVTTGKKRKESP